MMDTILTTCRATQRLYMHHVVVSFYEIDEILYICLENFQHVQTIACIVSEVCDMQNVQVWAKWNKKWTLMFKR